MEQVSQAYLNTDAAIVPSRLPIPDPPNVDQCSPAKKRQLVQEYKIKTNTLKDVYASLIQGWLVERERGGTKTQEANDAKQSFEREIEEAWSNTLKIVGGDESYEHDSQQSTVDSQSMTGVPLPPVIPYVPVVDQWSTSDTEELDKCIEELNFLKHYYPMRLQEWKRERPRSMEEIQEANRATDDFRERVEEAANLAEARLQGTLDACFIF